jgi:lipopolysaccharide transport system permease protein
MENRFDLIIEPGRAEKNYWSDLWRYRELFYILSWRDLKVRYKQTLIGIAWSIIRPLLTMLIFSVVFGRFAKLPSEGLSPYPLMVFTGLLPWQFFSNSLTESSGSLIGNTNLISKVYFPRLIIPASSIITCFVDFLISVVILAGLMVNYKFMPSIQILYLPFFILISLFASFGAGLWLTTMTIKFRDFRYIVPFIVQLGLYISPVGFSSTVVPEKWRLLYSLNPMVGVIDGFRWAILGGESKLYIPGLMISIGVTIVLVWYSVRHFRKMERAFADYI